MKKAFSLLELSIVMVIIAALIITVTVADALKGGASIKMTMKDIEKVNVAINAFYDTLNSVPGDSNQVYKYWASTCASEAACNGDGDQIIELYKESHLAWYHLNLAGLFPGNFTGQGDGDSQTQTANVNVPRASFNSGQYAILHYHGPEFPDEHMILLGRPVSGNIGYGALIDANSAYEIDTKMDDGYPSAGEVYGRNGYDGDWDTRTCLIDSNSNRVANSETVSTAVEYNMNVSTDECILGFKFKNNIGLNAVRTATD